MRLPFAQGHRYGMVGLGKTGQATARALHDSGAQVYAWDDKAESRDALKAAVPDAVLAPFESWPWESMHELILSPGVPLTHPVPHASVGLAKKHGVPIIGDIELLWRANPRARYVAITGTNGKSTTTSLIAHILQQAGYAMQVGGNLGTPVLSLAPLGADGVYVLELSSYQLDLLHLAHFQVALLLNFSPDHLDRHGDMNGYIAAKRHIFDRQTAGDVAIVGVDDAYSEALAREMLAAGPQRVVPISVTQTVGNGLHATKAVLHNNISQPKETIDIAAVRALQGAHNWQNALAAYAACATLGLSHAQIAAGMQSFPGLAHRMQWLGEVGKVAFVNDSKATNADAAEKALLTYNDVYWIIGGVPKAGGITPLAKYFHKVRHAYLIGQASAEFAQTLAGHVPSTDCGTLQAATQAAARDAAQSNAAHPVVLLSPACASFDQYPNFEKRGEAFMQYVDAVRAEGGAHVA